MRIDPQETLVGAFMKITDVKATTVKIPLEKVFSGSVYDVGFRCTIITSFETYE